jgi:hypothetical protein
MKKPKVAAFPERDGDDSRYGSCENYLCLYETLLTREKQILQMGFWASLSNITIW